MADDDVHEPRDPSDPEDADGPPTGSNVIMLAGARGNGADSAADDPAAAESAESAEPEPSGSEEPDARVVLVDQRMRQRRIAVLRHAGQRRLRRLAWMVAPLAALVTGAVLIHLPMADVDRIEVRGGEHTAAASVRWASGIDAGDTLATLDEHEAEHRIEQLSWVAEADVIRQWPDTVRIVVRERRPAAVVDLGPTAAAVVDAAGRVLDIGAAAPFGLVAVTGVEGRLTEGATLPSDARDALELAVAVNKRVPGAVVSVHVDLDATLNVGGVARFGTAERLDDKLVALATFLADVDPSCLEVLDVRVPSSVAVRRGAC